MLTCSPAQLFYCPRPKGALRPRNSTRPHDLENAGRLQKLRRVALKNCGPPTAPRRGTDRASKRRSIRPNNANPDPPTFFHDFRETGVARVIDPPRRREAEPMPPNVTTRLRIPVPATMNSEPRGLPPDSSPNPFPLVKPPRSRRRAVAEADRQPPGPDSIARSGRSAEKGKEQ